MFLGLSFLELWFIITVSLLLTYITTNGIDEGDEIDERTDQFKST